MVLDFEREILKGMKKFYTLVIVLFCVIAFSGCDSQITTAVGSNTSGNVESNIVNGTNKDINTYSNSTLEDWIGFYFGATVNGRNYKGLTNVSSTFETAIEELLSSSTIGTIANTIDYLLGEPLFEFQGEGVTVTKDYIALTAYYLNMSAVIPFGRQYCFNLQSSSITNYNFKFDTSNPNMVELSFTKKFDEISRTSPCGVLSSQDVNVRIVLYNYNGNPYMRYVAEIKDDGLIILARTFKGEMLPNENYKLCNNMVDKSNDYTVNLNENINISPNTYSGYKLNNLQIGLNDMYVDNDYLSYSIRGVDLNNHGYINYNYSWDGKGLISFNVVEGTEYYISVSNETANEQSFIFMTPTSINSSIDRSYSGDIASNGYYKYAIIPEEDGDYTFRITSNITYSYNPTYNDYQNTLLHQLADDQGFGIIISGDNNTWSQSEDGFVLNLKANVVYEVKVVSSKYYKYLYTSGSYELNISKEEIDETIYTLNLYSQSSFIYYLNGNVNDSYYLYRYYSFGRLYLYSNTLPTYRYMYEEYYDDNGSEQSYSYFGTNEYIPEGWDGNYDYTLLAEYVGYN